MIELQEIRKREKSKQNDSKMFTADSMNVKGGDNLFFNSKIVWKI